MVQSPDDISRTDLLLTYAEFAPFYDALLRFEGRDHQQARVLTWLFNRYAVALDANVADLACGCGGAVARMIDAGFVNTIGCDASSEMLAFARSHSTRGIFTQCSWLALRSVFPASTRFKAVWALGHSIAHCPDHDFPDVLNAFRKSLTHNGLCILDVRDWIETAVYPAFESGRAVGAYRWLGRLMVNGHPYDIEDLCDYEGQYQTTTYRVTRTGSPPFEGREFRFSWSTRNARTICEKMRVVGFARAETLQHPEWPYLLVVGVNA